MTHLVFLEDTTQVFWIKRSLPLNPKKKLVALTAEAIQALEESSLPHEAVSAYADMRQLACSEEQFNVDCFSIVQEIESFIARQYPSANFDGPGFLIAQAYYIQYSVSALATRALLLRETIRKCSPEVVTAFEGSIDPWFLGDGYGRNAWLGFLEALAEEAGFQLEVLRIDPGESRNALQDLKKFSKRVYHYALQKAARLLPRESKIHSPVTQLDSTKGIRLLMLDGLGYDWAPVLAALGYSAEIDCFAINSSRLDNREWTHYYSSSISRLRDGSRHQLNVHEPRTDESELRTITELFDYWLLERSDPRMLNVLGMNLFPYLTTHLRSVASLSPAIARGADEVANRALELTKPDAVCFAGMPWLSAKRVAYQCRQRRIPVVCFQHGGAYGTHGWIPHQLCELGYADYFITYGSGIRPPLNATFPVRARYVPVGSTRIESMAAKPSPSPANRSKNINILWIAELSTRNTFGGTFLVEDTSRYLLQKKCLNILGGVSHLIVTYRTHGHQIPWEGTTRWLERAKLRSIRINSSQPLDGLIRASDIVITDTSSGTVWNEVLALKKPLILYCDPDQTRLAPHFMVDLERACYWCKSREVLVTAVHRLAVDGEVFVAELRKIDATAFVGKYVLHRQDGRCVERVVSFLNNVCRNGQSIDDWERAMLNATALP